MYISYFALLPGLIVLRGKQPWVISVFLAGVTATCACLLWHLWWPSTVVRLDDNVTGSWLLTLVYQLDSPMAALPSGHVAMPVAMSVVLWCHDRRLALFFSAWTALLALSTLTTGQHVLWDCLAGALLGLSIGLLFNVANRFEVDARSLCALGFEWLLIALAFTLALHVNHIITWLAVFIFTATRQHALLMLYHDAVHGHLCRHRGINDTLINALVGVPLMLPVEVYRPLHLKHHRRLGHGDDPERTYLFAGQPWDFQPLAWRQLSAQIAGDFFFFNSLRTYHAWRKDGGRICFSNRTRSILFVWVSALAIALLIGKQTTVLVLAMWFLAAVTLTNGLQKLRSFAEHSAGPYVTPGWPHWTYAWRPGWLGRLTLWPYNMHRHLQHHARPELAWHQLGDVAVGYGMPARSLWSLLKR